MASVLQKTGLVARRANGAATFGAGRSFGTTARSAKTPDPDADDDNILPVRINSVLTISVYV